MKTAREKKESGPWRQSEGPQITGALEHPMEGEEDRMEVLSGLRWGLRSERKG